MVRDPWFVVSVLLVGAAALSVIMSPTPVC